MEYKETSTLPEVCSPTSPEVVRKSVYKEVAHTRDAEAPEVVNGEAPEVVHHVDYTKVDGGYYGGGSPQAEDSRTPPPYEVGASKGRRKKRHIVVGIFVIIVILGVGLGAGLGVGLQKKNDASSSPANSNTTSQSSDSSSPAPSIDTADLSTRGAFNGTDVAYIQGVHLTDDGGLETDQDLRDLLIFYQDYTGKIRWMLRTADPQSYSGGTGDDVVVEDARNNTPITTVGVTSAAGDKELHLLYIDKDNILRQRYKTSSDPSWQAGPLDDLNFVALNYPNAAFETGTYVGPISGQDLDGVGSCLKIFVGTSQATIDEFSWCSGMDEWHHDQQWTGVDGRSKPSFVGWDGNSTVYVAMMDSSGSVQLYWKDTDDSEQETSDHPPNVWTAASNISIPNIDPLPGLHGLEGRGTLIARASNGGPLQHYQIDLSAENSTVTSTQIFCCLDNDALADSTINVVLDHLSAPQRFYVWYQTEGDDVSLARGDLTNGSLSDEVVWAVPDD